MKNIEKPTDSTVYKLDKKTLALSIESLGLVKLKEVDWQKRKSSHPDHCHLLRSASEWSIGLAEGLI